MMTKPLLGLLGILIAASTAELNDVVTSIALVDVRGAFGISYDPGTWIQSLYVSAEIVGMAVSPWQLVTFTLRRWTLFSIALCALSSALIPFSPNIEAIYVLRPLQGFSEGLIIPLLMTTALRALTPQSRLYGLAVYALSSTFTPALAATLAALWTDVVGDWRFVFFQAVPLCMLAGVLVWYGDPQDETHYERFHVMDWRGIVLLAVGFGAFSTMLYQGDRLDWFNSPLICVLALVSGVAIPLFVLNEWLHPLPLIRFQLLGRRNMAYGGIYFSRDHSIGHHRTAAVPAAGARLSSAPVQSHHARDRAGATCVVAGCSVFAGFSAGRRARRQLRRARSNAHCVRRLVVGGLHLEPRSVFRVGGIPSGRPSHGRDVDLDDGDQFGPQSGRSAVRIGTFQHASRRGGGSRCVAPRVDHPLARQLAFRSHRRSNRPEPLQYSSGSGRLAKFSNPAVA